MKWRVNRNEDGAGARRKKAGEKKIEYNPIQQRHIFMVFFFESEIQQRHNGNRLFQLYNMHTIFMTGANKNVEFYIIIIAIQLCVCVCAHVCVCVCIADCVVL